VRRRVNTFPAAHRRPRLRPSRAIAARRDTPAMSRCVAHDAPPLTQHARVQHGGRRPHRPPPGVVRGATACQGSQPRQRSSVTQRGGVRAPQLSCGCDAPVGGRRRSPAVALRAQPQINRWPWSVAALPVWAIRRPRTVSLRAMTWTRSSSGIVVWTAIPRIRASIRVGVERSQPPGAGWLLSQPCGPHPCRSCCGHTAGTAVLPTAVPIAWARCSPAACALTADDGGCVRIAPRWTYPRVRGATPCRGATTYTSSL
jgi:hypothetical protein